MRTLRLAFRLLPSSLALIAAGCASVTGGRPGGPPQVRTITSVGDKPLPVVAGTPGDAVVSSRVTPERRPSAEGRISGRVLDERGRTVPNAQVRLAVDGAAKGTAVRATTDRAGGFTLHGLRPGGSYTVIAEWEDEQGLHTGRADVRAPDTRVRISLHEPGHDEPAAPPSRINRVSDREAADAVEAQESEFPGGIDEEPEAPARINEEDLPPAPEAAVLPPEPPEVLPPQPSSPELSARTRTGWRRGGDLVRNPEASAGVGARTPASTADLGDAGGSDQDPLADDEGPNPLPEAIEPTPSPPPRTSRTSSGRSGRSPSALSIPRGAEPSSQEVIEPDPPPRSPSAPPADLPEPPRDSSSNASDPAEDLSSAPDPGPTDFNPSAESPRRTAPITTEPPDPSPITEPTARRPAAMPRSKRRPTAPVAQAEEPAPPPPNPVAPARSLPGSSPSEVPEIPTDPEMQPEPTPSTFEPGPSQLPTPSKTDADTPSPTPNPTNPAVPPADSELMEAPTTVAPAAEPAPTPASPASVPERAALPEVPEVPAEVPAPEPVPTIPAASAEVPTPDETRATSGAPEADRGRFDALSPSDRPPLVPQPTRPSGPAPAAPEPADLDPPPAAQASASPPRRATWDELPPPTPTQMISTRPRSSLPGRSGRRRPSQDDLEKAVRAACQFDAKHQKLIDFRLPDLQGQPVRFQDLDADLILIDFWGTWCGPCINSIPHLVELQDRFGTQRLRVVGIAYEQGPLEDRVATVAATVRRLGINYPVLLGPTDGSCPLQAALHVQAYPTMILVDRHGRILWRDQGSTPMTLARLDRVVAAATRPDTVRR